MPASTPYKPVPVHRPHWLWELDDAPRDRYVYCDRHSYWYRESQGCYLCAKEGRESVPSIRRV